VMDNGCIIETGTHDDLLQARGYYAELERVQREGADEEDLSNARLSTP